MNKPKNTPGFIIQIANGNSVPVKKQVTLRFFLAGKVFDGTVLVVPTIGTISNGTIHF